MNYDTASFHYRQFLPKGILFRRPGYAPDGAFDEGAVDGARCGVDFKAVDLAGAQLTGKFQLTSSGIDNCKHATA